MKYIAYHRTSTREQHLDRGITEIEKFCMANGMALFKNKVYTDQQTGKNFDRPTYAVVKELLDTGDVLVVTELDRLGRNKEATLNELRFFKDNGIRVMILEIPTTLQDISKLDNKMASMVMETINNMLIELYATIAHAEMEKREKRQREGIEAMKARGEWEQYGRPRALSAASFAQQFAAVERGEIRPFELMRKLGVSKPTFYRYKYEYENNKKGEKNA
ncbi:MULTISPECIES: recombinase family protein [Oscillibacter]|uniref:recombinase family protein n=1 Tax=Oscillibacter TaxID=459786 RepID=UPI00289F5DBF|nr:recombinase family protein [Oscillibacter sp.]